MSHVIDAGVDTRSQRPEDRLAPLLDEVPDHVEQSRPRALLLLRLSTTTNTSAPYVAHVDTALPAVNLPPRQLDPGDIALWQTLRNWLAHLEPSDTRTQATSLRSTTVSSIRSLLRARHRDERLARMTPERRAIYERIKRLRDAIGPIDFDVLDALRELREDA